MTTLQDKTPEELQIMLAELRGFVRSTTHKFSLHPRADPCFTIQMKFLRLMAKHWLCWAGIHKIDPTNRGYVGYYWCERCKKYVRE